MSQEDRLARMREDWDRRARQNSRHYIANCRETWPDEEFHRSGEETFEADIASDMGNICRGNDPGRMKVLEIGCGAGRLTRAFAKRFGEVHAVDISGEMIRQAREELAEFPNVHLYQNNGADLRVVPAREFDFAYSTAVFHHIGSREIIESYVAEVNRLLRPGALFKFDLQGCLAMGHNPEETWLGAPFSERQAVEMAVRCGFDPRYRHGAGHECFWWWFFKWEE
jgi:SAM-dependent methyltransferase